MDFENLPADQIKDLLEKSGPQYTGLVEHLLEYWASLKDNDINNHLLQDLVLKYSSAEKKLVQLNQALIEKQKHLDEDLRAAAEIQKSLLPSRAVSLKNFDIAWKFEPCEHMGGDIFDIIRLDADHWGIYMLDVSGHGVPAAMITVCVTQFLQQRWGRTDAHTPSTSISTPVETLKALDGEFPFERFKHFFTIACMNIDTSTGEIVYSNAGHPYPIILRRSGTMELLEKGGPVIGMGEFYPLSGQQNHFEEGRTVMRPGDKLFLFTDGIVEYQNHEGKLYGHDRFYKKLKELKAQNVQDIVERAMIGLKEFGHNAKPQDDVTLLGLAFAD